VRDIPWRPHVARRRRGRGSRRERGQDRGRGRDGGALSSAFHHPQPQPGRTYRSAPLEIGEGFASPRAGASAQLWAEAACTDRNSLYIWASCLAKRDTGKQGRRVQLRRRQGPRKSARASPVLGQEQVLNCGRKQHVQTETVCTSGPRASQSATRASRGAESNGGGRIRTKGSRGGEALAAGLQSVSCTGSSGGLGRGRPGQRVQLQEKCAQVLGFCM
jgi:hypothetical protein